MKYINLKVELKEFKDRFNRNLYVNNDISLFQLGYVIGESLGCDFDKEFMFNINDVEFASSLLLSESYDEEIYDYKRVNLKDLNLRKDDQFIFIYDLNDNYEFVITVLDNDINIDEEYFAKCLSAKGDIIFENEKETLLAYLSNKIDSVDNELYFLPNNVNEDYELKDFDGEVDIDEINMMIENDNSSLIDDDFLDNLFKN